MIEYPVCRMSIWNNSVTPGIMMDVTESIEEVQWSTYLEDQPGKLVFFINRVKYLAFYEGGTVYFTVNGEKVFCGTIFKKERSEDVDLIKVTAYDYLVYLKSKDSFVFESKTLPQIIDAVCAKADFPYMITDAPATICTDRTFDNRSFMDVIQTSRDDILISTGEYYLFRANWQKLELINSRNLTSNLLLGDDSGIFSFNYTTSIDDSFNQVKLYRDNQDTGKREIFAVYDSRTIGRWGLLQYYESVSDNLNEKQVGARAEALLNTYNRTRRTFKVTDCLGDLSIFAGAIVKVQIADLGDITLNDNLIIRSCTHIFGDSLHTMSFDAEVNTIA